MRRMRCIIEEVVVRVTATGMGRRIGQDQVVDFDEVLTKGKNGAPDFTLADAVKPEWFVSADVAPAAPLHNVVDDEPTV